MMRVSQSRSWAVLNVISTAHINVLLAFHQLDRVEGLRLHRLAADILHVGESVHQEISLLFDLCITNCAQCFSHKSILSGPESDWIWHL
jgi:hypothetical protein